jgi:hypothetical protein
MARVWQPTWTIVFNLKNRRAVGSSPAYGNKRWGDPLEETSNSTEVSLDPTKLIIFI